MSDVTGRVWSFGMNNYGQLGQGYVDSNRDTSNPSIINSLQTKRVFIANVIASSYGGSFAIDH